MDLCIIWYNMGDMKKQLKVTHRKERNPNVWDRILVVQMIFFVYAHAETVDLFCRYPKGTSRWFRRFNEHSIDGSQDRSRSGRPFTVKWKVIDEIISHTSKTEIVVILKTLQTTIRNKTDKFFHITYVRKIMYEYDLSVNMPKKST